MKSLTIGINRTRTILTAKGREFDPEKMKPNWRSFASIRG
jgi:hypothetical protein